MSADKVTRRKIRRAIGPQAVDAMTDLEMRVLELERVTLQKSFIRRVWWLLTGRH